MEQCFGCQSYWIDHFELKHLALHLEGFPLLSSTSLPPYYWIVWHSLTTLVTILLLHRFKSINFTVSHLHIFASSVPLVWGVGSFSLWRSFSVHSFGSHAIALENCALLPFWPVLCDQVEVVPSGCEILWPWSVLVTIQLAPALSSQDRVPASDSVTYKSQGASSESSGLAQAPWSLVE